jgi:small subunit ribosomal protein S16
MAVKIRLMRIGAKNRPFYRVVAVDEHKKRTGAYLELLGTYNPLTQPKEIKLDQAKIDEWVKKGAILSDGFLRIIGKAKQRPPRKPKKAQPEEAAAPATPAPAETSAEKASASEEAAQEEIAPEATQSQEEAPQETTTETPVEDQPATETPAEETTQEASGSAEEAEAKE